MKKLQICIIASLIFCFAHLAAQQYEIPYSVFGGGGEVSGNSDYQLIGTLGQPLIGETGNLAHVKHIGFWYVMKMRTITAIDDPFNLQIPNKYVLMQNYPNPFNPITHIRFGLPKASLVRIELYNILGQRVVTLLDERKPAGYHMVDLNGSNLSSGIYLYRIQADGFMQIKKMVLTK